MFLGLNRVFSSGGGPWQISSWACVFFTS